MNNLRAFGVTVAATALSAFFAGCYTQVGSLRDGHEYGYTSESSPDNETTGQAAYDTSVVDSGTYDDNTYDQARRDFYNDCNSPSCYAGSTWYNPWWHVGFGYDPWYGGWPGWYGGYGYPAYWGWYPIATPYYGYYGSHGGYAYSRWNGARRTFAGGVARTFGAQGAYGVGSNRTSGIYRTSGTAASTVTRRSVPGSTVNRATAGTSTVSRARAATTSTRQGAVRSTGRGYSRGSYQSRARSAPPSYRGGSRSGGGRSYSPPASRGGSAPSGGGRSSGGGRGSSGGGHGRR